MASETKPLKVLISVGSKGNPQQEAFVKEIRSFFGGQGLQPVTAGSDVYKNQIPLVTVQECLRECCGVAVIAFERIYVEKGLERRGSQNKPVDKTIRTTVWNHMEFAMAVVLGLPLLVIAEEGLEPEGAVEGKGIYVQRVKLETGVVHGQEFIGIFQDWKQQCKSFSEHPDWKVKFDPEHMRVGEFIEFVKKLEVKLLWTLIVMALGAIGIVATAAYQLGTWAPHK
jgi:hypothetical protein